MEKQTIVFQFFLLRSVNPVSNQEWHFNLCFLRVQLYKHDPARSHSHTYTFARGRCVFLPNWNEIEILHVNRVE